MTEEKERARDYIMMENFYYTCIYDILQEPAQPREVCQITSVEGQNHQAAQQEAADYNG